MGRKVGEVEVGKVEGMAVDAAKEAVVKGGRHRVGRVIGEIEGEVGEGVEGGLHGLSTGSPSLEITMPCSS